MGLDLPFDDDEPITSFGAGRRSYIEKTGPPSPPRRVKYFAGATSTSRSSLIDRVGRSRALATS